MTTTTRPDPTLMSASELARAAAVEVAGVGAVGDALDPVAEGERLLTHRFACLLPGYPGWTWAVTVTRVPRGRTATVNEVALLRGEGALRTPEWVPWNERVQAGDLGPGTVLPSELDDERLVPGYSSIASVAEQADLPSEGVAELVTDLGLTRARLLSLAGQQEAIERWEDGDGGPESAMAKAAPKPCRTCGFRLPLATVVGAWFGVCTNLASPRDGQVVSMEYGCGAHSSMKPVGPAEAVRLPELAYDTLSEEPLALR